MIEQPVAAVGGLDHLMHAEEAARRLDAVEARAARAGQHEGEHDQRKEARRPLALQQHRGRERDQRDLERQSAAAGRRTSNAIVRRDREQRRRSSAGAGLVQEAARTPPDQTPGSTSTAAAIRIGYS